ncbi:unnamed protein product [Camellia sinensis]
MQRIEREHLPPVLLHAFLLHYIFFSTANPNPISLSNAARSSTTTASAAMASSSTPQRRRLTLTSAEKVAADDNLLKQIFIRLPPKPLFSFKTVSERWFNLISDPYVVGDWIPPNSPSSFYFRRYSSPFSPDIEFNHISVNGFVDSSLPVSLNLFDEPDGVKILQSCNGLLLISSSWPSADSVHTRYYVLNATTKKYSMIPRPKNGDNRNFLVSMNLAFDPAISLHYKVVAFRSRKWNSPNFRIAVYYSETQTWVFSEKSFTLSENIVVDNGIFLNGKIHWPRCYSKESTCYDINRDEFLPLPMPSCLKKVPVFFGECGGHLRLIECYKRCGRRFDVLELENDYSEWVVKYRVDLQMGVSAFPEMIRPCPGRFPTYGVDVLCFLGSEVGGDLCLMLYIPFKVISYNFKDRSFRKVCDLKLLPADVGFKHICASRPCNQEHKIW